MRSRIENPHAAGLPHSARTSIWIALVAGSSVLFSLALACATPFAALVTVAGTQMRRRDALSLIGVAWFLNQAVGYGLLGYPRTWDSFAWGAAIGVAAVLAAFAVSMAAGRFGSTIIVAGGAFLAAFAIHELALFAATAVLPSSAEAFSPSVVGWIFSINLLALAGLLAAHKTAVAAGFLPAPALMRPSLARA
ncbi:hypothetical protein ASG57_25835 [Bradyrhizobium sp. Leaf396]|jgi:hypothetical protein|nr:hypothetical protein ASG57_25835 [Bradyrhizobium sp. Leaf396]